MTIKPIPNGASDRNYVEQAELLALADAQAFDAETDLLDIRDWREDIALDDPEDFEWEPEPEPPTRKYAGVEPTNFREGIRRRRAEEQVEADGAGDYIAAWLANMDGAA